LALAYYIINTLLYADFSNKQALIFFLAFIFPYVLKALIGGYYLIHSLFQKAKDIDDSNLTALIAVLATNLSIFWGIFGNIQSANTNLNLLRLGTALSLAVIPFYLVALITLGYNLTILPEANSLNTKGVYSISRHPLYLCYIIWYVLQNFICQTWIMIILSTIQIVLQVLRAKYEEKLLEKNFPEYKDYKATVWWIGKLNIEKKYENTDADLRRDLSEKP
jgi:protein-S-isoprenylcysteine O-methyltransferase Ste14